MKDAAPLESLADIYEVELVVADGASRQTPPGLLVEVPHGATRWRHFAATRARLVGDYPDDLEQFFYVNTDVGAIEVSRYVARMATRPGRFRELAELQPTADLASAGFPSVLILRGLVARTFIDCNRVISGGPSGRLRDGMTPGLPAYVRRGEDVETLKGMHADYQTAARRAYEAVCGAGGTAVTLHTYAPRSVRIGRLDDGIVAALRRAYEPGVYERWPRRPDVDLITETVDGVRLASEALAAGLRDRYAAIGADVRENATYRLHEATMGYVHSVNYPDRVVCLEINRGLLADPYTPFVEMSIDAARARRMAAPIAAALLEQAAARPRGSEAAPPSTEAGLARAGK